MSKSRATSTKPEAVRRKQSATRARAGLRLIPVSLSDEIKRGDSLCEKLLQALRQNRLAFQPGDILVVKHKIVSKSEGRIVDLATSHRRPIPSPGQRNTIWTPASSNLPCARAAPSSAARTACSSPRRVTVSFAPTAAWMSPTSMADITRCFCPSILTVPPANFIANLRSTPSSLFPFSLPTRSAVPGAKAWSTSASASPG